MKEFHSFFPGSGRDSTEKYRVTNGGIEIWKKDGIFSKFKMKALRSFHDIEIKPYELHGNGNGIVSVRHVGGYEEKVFVENAAEFVSEIVRTSGNTLPDFEFRNGC